jgi:hypothetical protein
MVGRDVYLRYFPNVGGKDQIVAVQSFGQYLGAASCRSMW